MTMLGGMQTPTPGGTPPTTLLTVAEAAMRLSIGRSHLYALMASGELRSIRLGRRRLIPESAIEDLIADALLVEAGRP